MFFRRFTSCLLSVAVLSSQVYANELPAISSPNYYTSYNDFRNFKSPIDYELDQAEAVLKQTASVQVRSVSSGKSLIVKEVSPSQESLKVAQKVTVVPPTVQPPKVVPKLKVQQQSNSPQKKDSTQVLGASPGEIKTISIDEIASASSGGKLSIRLVYNSKIIIQAKNIQRFLAMDEGFLNVERIDHNQIMVKAIKYGGTFLNVWDDGGRRTIYIGIIFPEYSNSQSDEESKIVEHEKPFRFSYSSDYNTYYNETKEQPFKRQSYGLTQNYAFEGQSPYGYFDSSIATDNFNGISSISSYTTGLSNIPLEGTSHLSLRSFDATRTLSQLTMSNMRLRGIFADTHLFDDRLGLDYSYGQKKPYFVFLSQGGSSHLNSYVNAFKLTLFPNDYNNQLSFNAAEGFGSAHESNLSKKVYSIEARKKISNAYLNGEYAESNNQHASIAGARWQQGFFNSAFNFRQTNKNYTTVSGQPATQGEVGGLWTTDFNTGTFSESTTLNVYRQYLYFNPNDPQALNYDISGHVRLPLVRNFWSDTNVYYVHTPGEISPRRNVNLNQKISRLVNFLDFKNTNVYVEGVLQRARYGSSGSSDYDRFSLLQGIQIPITSALSVYSNYEYSWVHELATLDDINPYVFSTGLSYAKQLTPKISENFSLSYRNEGGTQGTTSYLSGEDSAGLSLGFTYTPIQDVSLFFDSQARKVWPSIEGNLSYNDLSIRIGFRMSFDVLKRGWDPRGSVSGYVYKDKNANGRYDKAEDIAMKAVKVKVGESDVLTNNEGFYTKNVTAKRVLVSPNSETLPSGVVFATAPEKTVDIKPWGTTRTDFGLNSQTGVYGLLFVDQNNNGIPDSADKYIKKVKIILDQKKITYTDGHGAYYFRSITEGVHSIKVDINSLPIDMIPLINLENKINVADATTYVFHIPLKASKNNK